VSSVVDYRDGASRTLDGRPQPDEIVAESDAADTTLLARLLTRILGELAALRRRWVPRSITFTDIVSTGTDMTPVTKSLTHKFGGQVNWTVVGCATTSTIVIPLVIDLPASTADTLLLAFYYSGTFAVRVEERG
jgi:hypothetical protein